MAISAGDFRFHHPNSEGSADGGALASYAVDSATNTASEVSIVDSELSQADDYWNGAILCGLTGNLAGVWVHVIDFDAATNKLIFPFQFAVTPGAGDTYQLILSKTNAYRASLEIPGKSITALANVTGFTVEYVAANNEDSVAAELKFAYNGGSGQGLSWNPDGAVGGSGAQVDISAMATDDEVHLSGATLGQSIRVKRTAAALPTSDQTDVLTITMPENRLLPLCSGSETAAGRIHYAQVFVRNAHASATLPAVEVYCLPPVADAAETTIASGGNIVADADDILTATALTDWPASGWVYHKTAGVVDDVRYYHGKDGNVIKVQDPTGGQRGFSEAIWSDGDTIGLYADIDIALTALSSDQFPDPSGLSYSAPLAEADALAIGDLDSGESYGVAIRETVPAAQHPRADLLSQLAFVCQVAEA